MDKKQLDDILPLVEKPARYTGNEYNITIKENASFRFALCFPDVYEISMSHLGSRILYNIVNKQDDMACERCFAPWVDMEKQMRDNDIPLFSLETKRPLKDFDAIGFSLLYELCYTNILTMLSLSGLPFLAKDRTDEMPLIICGGPCVCNAEPIAPFFDCVLYGDGEELLPELLTTYKQLRASGLTKTETLPILAKIEGVYIPSAYTPKYDGQQFVGMQVAEGYSPTVMRRIVKNLDSAEYIGTPIVPHVGIIHDRIPLELFRGCTRGCRFCQAGMIYRPVRERSSKTIIEQAHSLIACTGYDEISLFSLSSGDYSEINTVISQLITDFYPERVSLSLPSLRIDSINKDNLERISSIRKTGLTLAPEAGTQRLRDVINKGVTEEDLEKSVLDAFNSGWSSVKLYFMIGLPTETTEDILGIAELARKVSRLYYELPKEDRKMPLRISVSASSFVPKPATPFQWVAQDTLEQLKEKQMLLKSALKGIRGVEFSYHDPYVSTLESVFARGDRRIANAIIYAYEHGARFDAWDEHFQPELWADAFAACDIDRAYIAHRERNIDEPLPWGHLHVRVTEEYLKREYNLAMKGVTTRDCRAGCNGCMGDDYENYCKH